MRSANYIRTSHLMALFAERYTSCRFASADNPQARSFSVNTRSAASQNRRNIDSSTLAAAAKSTSLLDVPDTHITDTQRPPPYCLTAAETKKARD